MPPTATTIWPRVDGNGTRTACDNSPVRFDPYSAMIAPGDPTPLPVGAAALRTPPLLMEGAGPITKFDGREAPAPREGLNTITAARPTACTSDAGMLTASIVAVADVTGRSCPFQSTCTPGPKFEPLIVSVKSERPALTVDGTREDMTGGKPAADPSA